MKLLAFPFHDWRKGQQEGFRTRDQHILEWLGRDPSIERLLVVDRPVPWLEPLVKHRGWSIRGRTIAQGRSWQRRWQLTEGDNGVLVLDQATSATYGPAVRRRGWWFDAFDDREAQTTIAWAVRELGGIDACIAWQPAATPALLTLGKPFVVDSLDNWLIHPAFARWRDRSSSAYAQLIPSAQAVFVSAPASRDVLRQWRLDIEIVPNGVDTEAFARLPARPNDMRTGPVVGYIGKLARRIDAEFVVRVACLLPEVTFAFVGPVLEKDAVRPMMDVPNIHLLGDRHYSSMPAYVGSFDICWIPHRVGEGETGGDPIKLYEYWAAGKQVVSTRIDGMEAWNDRLLLVDTAMDAAGAIGGLLRGSIVLPQPSVPADRTWQAITNRVIAPLRVETASEV